MDFKPYPLGKSTACETEHGYLHPRYYHFALSMQLLS